MHCDCCDKLLSDYECSFKSEATGEYLNTCRKCLTGLDIAYVGNYVLDKSAEESFWDELEIDEPLVDIDHEQLGFDDEEY
jgi:hypothetical protein